MESGKIKTIRIDRKEGIPLKKDLFAKVTALTLALAMALSGCGRVAAPAESSAAPEEVPAVLGNRHFSELTYERYDSAPMDSLMAEIQEKLPQEGTGQEVLDLFDRLLEEYERLDQAYTLAELYNAQNTADTFYQEELAAMEKLDTDKVDAISCLGKAVLNSNCGELAREQWDEDDVEYYEKYIEMTDAQKEMSAKETALITTYREASTQDYTVTFEGTEYNLDTLEADEKLSYRDYYAVRDQIYQKKNEALGAIYVELVKLRQEQAKSYGYDSYTDYRYDYVYQRDYTKEDAAALCEQVKDDMVYTNLLMWYGYDYDSGEKLNEIIAEMPISEQMEKMRSYLPQVDESLVESFDYMETYGLYDLERSDKKMSAGFTTFLSADKEPFLFNQPDGSFYDMMSLVHEFGHFNAFCENVEKASTESNLDLAEIHSQGLEFLYTHFYSDMLGRDMAETASYYTMLQKLNAVVSGCMYDEFQREVYAMENPTLEGINALFGRVAYDYGMGGRTADEPCYDWVDVSHNFESPLYYISYAVSVLPAFEIWEESLMNFNNAVDLYMDVVRAGEGDDYKEVLEQCDLHSPFEKGYISTLADFINEYYSLDETRNALVS